MNNQNIYQILANNMHFLYRDGILAKSPSEMVKTSRMAQKICYGERRQVGFLMALMTELWLDKKIDMLLSTFSCLHRLTETLAAPCLEF